MSAAESTTTVSRRAEPAYQEDLPGCGRLRLVQVSPGDDVGLIHSWVAEDRARFWGMGSHTRAQVLEIYEFLDSLDTRHAYQARARCDAVTRAKAARAADPAQFQTRFQVPADTAAATAAPAMSTPPASTQTSSPL